MLDDFEKSIQQKFLPLVEKIQLYIKNVNNQIILLNPIIEQIQDSIEQLKIILLENYLEVFFYYKKEFFFIIYNQEEKQLFLEKIEKIEKILKKIYNK